MKTKKIEVVAAIIYFNNKILCVQRDVNKYDYISEKYEFPGGKIESEETHEEALKREIVEELDMKVDIKKHYLTVKHSYPDFHLTMHSYICHCNSEVLKLREHISYKWLNPQKIDTLDWAAADIPIMEKLKTTE